MEHAVDRRGERAREVRTERSERRCALLHAARGLERRERGKRVLPGQGLPEQDADRPDVRGAVGLMAGESLGRDVGESPGDVAHCCQGVGLLQLGETEVEEPDGERLVVLDHDVPWLHIPVEDLLPVRMPKCVEHLGGHFHRGPVVELSAAQALAEGLAADVLVGDVDVLVVALEGERA
jgi:hypothetical protein